MRTIVIGDIHGCYYTLIRLLEKLEIQKDNQIIFLGDYVDRGKNSYEVIEGLQEIQKQYNCICLLGNHEAMMIDAIETKECSLWKQSGGDKTLKSYQKNGALRTKHLNWLKGLPVIYETRKNLFSHAGFPKTITLENTFEDMVWGGNCVLDKSEPNEKIAIFGHYPNDRVFKTLNGNIGIDTGCVYGGKLTALVLDENTISILDVEKDSRD